MPTPGRDVSLGYLRTFLTLLVVAHHAVLAYFPFAPPRPASLTENQAWAAFPVVDNARWPGIEIFVSFNDSFFMSLLFLISGVFAWASLERKGAARFAMDRVRKLGTAFLFSALVLAPLAYYPAYLALGPQATSFAQQWVSLGSWPAGPAWFLWVLVVFAGTAALVHPRLRGFYLAMGRLGARPLVFFLAVVGLSALAYVPMAAVISPFHWWSFGPFFVQTSRVLLYALYFFIGIALGSHGASQGLFAADGRLARRWPAWAGAALLGFVANVAVFVALVVPTLAKGGPSPVILAASSFAFVVCCATASLACVAFFARFARTPNRLVDSLSANALGIYLAHYAFVTWLQLALLPVPATGFVKAILVFAGAVLASWGLTAAVRRVLFAKGAATALSPATA